MARYVVIEVPEGADDIQFGVIQTALYSYGGALADQFGIDLSGCPVDAEKAEILDGLFGAGGD